MSSGYLGGFRKQEPKTAADHYQQRRARRRVEVSHPIYPVTLDQIADRDLLYECYQELRLEGGPAPGPDKVTYAALCNSEVGELLGQLAGELLKGNYRPSRTRTVKIPKPGKSGHRTLHIGNILDRVVAKALNKQLTPIWERIFLPCSFGFRPNHMLEGNALRHDTWTMLAELEAQMQLHGRWVVAIDDLKSAFDNVPIKHTLECHRKMFASLKLGSNSKRAKSGWAKETERLMKLISVVLRGGDDNRQRGIDQGNNYSPTALNALLHYWLDVPLTARMKHPLWFRYADNFAYVAKSVSEGKHLLGRVGRRLKPLGMNLKGEDGVADLNAGEEVQLLGFIVSRVQEQIRFGLGNQALANLAERLSKAHDHEDPPKAARQSFMGWISSCGPAFENGVSQIPMLLNLAAERGFRELASTDVLRQRWEWAWDRWSKHRQKALGV